VNEGSPGPELGQGGLKVGRSCSRISSLTGECASREPASAVPDVAPTPKFNSFVRRSELTSEGSARVRRVVAQSGAAITRCERTTSPKITLQP